MPVSGGYCWPHPTSRHIGSRQARLLDTRCRFNPIEIDAGRFERMVADASRLAAAGPDAAARPADEALALWRGPAFAEFVDASFASAEAAPARGVAADGLRAAIRVQLALGRHTELIADLQSFIAAHPLREVPHAQLMLALYRSGRHAEALEVYQNYQGLLGAELGLAPSAGLRTLQAQILRQAADLDWTPHSPWRRPAESIRRLSWIDGRRNLQAGQGARRAIPTELTSFIGREPK